MFKQQKVWKWFFSCFAITIAAGILSGCPVSGPVNQTVTGTIASADTTAQTVTVTTSTGSVTLNYEGASIFLPGDTTTPTGTEDDLNPGAAVSIATRINTDATVTVVSITIGVTTGPDTNNDHELGQGSLIIPEDETALVVDGMPFSRDADLGNGSLDWYRFPGTAGVKYDILARGNAPLVISVYKVMPVQVNNSEVMAAVMLWTTDPEAPADVFYVDSGLQPATKQAKAVRIPSFVAPDDGEYYVSVQAAQIWVEHGLSGHVAYYHLSSYTVQVSTVPDPSTAAELLTADPATNPAFTQGAVTVYQGDWFYFDGLAGQNYMIEFRPLDPEIRYTLKANVFAPDNSIACTAYACSECKATSFYSPVDARYLVRVVLDPDDDSPLTEGELEWGQAEYLIRILDDDHGNYPPFATLVALEEGGGASTTIDGFLSTDDADVFEFSTNPFRTYRAVTVSDTDVRLQDFELGQPPFDRNLDGIGNEFTLFQNDTAWPEDRMAGVLTLEREFEPGDSRNTFGLLHGPYQLIIQNDDHADEGAPLYMATTHTLGTQSSGVLWGDTDRDTDPADGNAVADVFDTDLFAFTPAIRPIWHRADLAEASSLQIGNQPAVEDDLSTEVIAERDHYESTSTSTAVPVVVGGPNSHLLQTSFTLDIIQEDFANRDGDASVNAANAAALTEGTARAGVLWGAPGDNDIFRFTAAPNRTYKVSISGANGNTSLGGTDNVVATYDLAGNNRAVSVRHGEVDPVTNIVQVSLGADTNADLNYSVQYEDDDYVDSVDPMEEDTLTAISATATGGTLFKGDTDLFRFEAEPNLTYRVSITGADGAVALSATNTVALYDIEDPEFDRAISVRHNGMDAQTIVVTVAFDGEESDIDYNVSVLADDHVDQVNPMDAQAVAALTLLGAQSRSGVLFQGDTDSFRLSAIMGTTYEITPVNDNIVLSVNGVPIVPAGDVYTYTHAAADGDVIVQVTRSVDAPEDADVSYSLTANAV